MMRLLSNYRILEKLSLFWEFSMDRIGFAAVWAARNLPYALRQ